MPPLLKHKGREYDEKAMIKLHQRRSCFNVHADLVCMIIMAYRALNKKEGHLHINHSPSSKCSSRKSTKLLLPPLRSMRLGISCTTLNVYAHLSPSVHPLSGPAQAPVAFLASMNPVSELKIVKGLFIARCRKYSASLVLLSRPASTETAKSSSNYETLKLHH